MAKIDLPRDILKKEKLSSLPPKERNEYINNVLKKILELNPDGVTTSQITSATGYTYSTIWHHLEMISSTEECHKLQHGNTDIYIPIKNIASLNVDLPHGGGKSTYSFNIVEDKFGRYVYAHRKIENRLGNADICSGICVPYSLLDNFIYVLTKVKESSVDKKQYAKK